MRCHEARAALDSALERELALEQRLRLEAHLAGCAACARRAARARRLQELLEGPGDPRPVRADVESAVQTVFARLDRGEGAPLELPRPRRARRLLVPLLAAAALVAVLAVRALAPRPAPTPALPAPEPAPVAAAPWAEGEVELAVRAALLESFAASAPEAEALARFQERLREPARAGWPLRRFVEGLAERPDPGTAQAALRCLGALGDANALPALERALERAELAPTAFVALEALAPASFAVLERALGAPRLAPGALASLCRLGGERAARILERAARSAGPHANPSRATLLDALTATGPDAVASLLRLAGEAREPDEARALVARLTLVAGAGPALAHALEDVREPAEWHYAALLALQPFEALPWLAERCASHRQRPAALAVLEAYPGTPPLATLLRLAGTGRVPRDELVRALVGLLERDAVRAPAFSREVLARAAPLEAQAWLALLLESGHPGAAAALVPIAAAEELGPEERQWAALAVGELGGEVEARELAGALPATRRLERRLAAATALSLQAHLGSEGVREWLGPVSPAALRRAAESLESGTRAGAAVRLHRVARALEDALSELETAPLARHEP